MTAVDNHNNHDHNHNHPHAEADRGLKARLRLSIALTGVILVAELAGGYFTNSLALMSDAAHVFMDVFALSLSLAAMHIAELPPTETRTYGLHRVEVFVSWINSFILILVTAFIFYSAYERFSNPQPVESAGMLVIAAVGLVVNLVVAMWLMSYAEGDLNVKSAYVHVVGDAAASVGVIVGAVVIAYTGWYFVDPLISDLIGAIILVGSFNIMKDASHILMEGVPKDIDFGRVIEDIKASKGVSSVHSLHIWSICHNVYALSAHLDIEPLERWRMGEIFAEVNERLAGTHHIFYTTLQAECSGCDTNDTLRKIAHRERNHLH
ncbi:MAG: cation transporter [Deltaproteobacteria bacterium]|nr:cation transporter [Deltaproteobacteria bacterium]